MGAGSRLLGVVLNKVDITDKDSYNYVYTYYGETDGAKGSA